MKFIPGNILAPKYESMIRKVSIYDAEMRVLTIDLNRIYTW